MLGAALGLSYGKHMIIEFVPQRLPRAIADWIALGLQLLGLLFLGVVVVKGIPLLELTRSDYYVTLPFPVMYAYLAVVVGAALMIFYWLFEIVATVRRLIQKSP
jgi:TRAP-type C4-dicarboxylate transport system permease small subunit